eukprot:4340502-Ditylum_brightwellii.AAC.1
MERQASPHDTSQNQMCTLCRTMHFSRSDGVHRTWFCCSVQARLKDKHPFGCPVFVLQTRLHNQQKFQRWNSRSRIDINLGPLPRQARNINLVLNSETGLCSPQFHVKYDDFFESAQTRDYPGKSLSSGRIQLA